MVSGMRSSADHLISLGFDTTSLDQELSKLSPAALEHIRQVLFGNVERLPFDLFVSQFVPAVGAGGADQVIIGFDFASRPQ